MFKKPQPKKSGASEPFTYIHQDTTLVGDLEARGRVRVHGTVRGNVTVAGVLEVAEAGLIEGDQVRADEVKIIGRVHANVDAKGKIEIWRKGSLVGDVRAAALDIEEGASFTGRSEMVTTRTAELPRPSDPDDRTPAEPSPSDDATVEDAAFEGEAGARP